MDTVNSSLQPMLVVLSFFSPAYIHACHELNHAPKVRGETHVEWGEIYDWKWKDCSACFLNV